MKVGRLFWVQTVVTQLIGPDCQCGFWHFRVSEYLEGSCQTCQDLCLWFQMTLWYFICFSSLCEQDYRSLETKDSNAAVWSAFSTSIMSCEDIQAYLAGPLPQMLRKNAATTILPFMPWQNSLTCRLSCEHLYHLSSNYFAECVSNIDCPA